MPRLTRETATKGIRGWLGKRVPEAGVLVLLRGILEEAAPEAVKADHLVTEGEIVEGAFRVLATPGHTGRHAAYVHEPTPERSCPPFGLWPSRTGLAVEAKTSKSSLGSRACCFSACAGPKTTQDRASHSRLSRLSCCLPPLGMESASWTNGFSKLNSPAH